MKVRFVIPIRHPDGVADRAKQLAELRQTLASIAAQSSTDWTATIVVNPAQVLPEIPERTRVRHVDLPPNTALAAARDREELHEGAPARQGPARRRRPRRRRSGRPRHGRRRRRPHPPRPGRIRCLEATLRVGDRQGLLVAIRDRVCWNGRNASTIVAARACSCRLTTTRTSPAASAKATRSASSPATNGYSCGCPSRRRTGGPCRSRRGSIGSRVAAPRACRCAASAVGAPVPRRTGLRTRLAALRRMRLMTPAIRRDFFGAA